MPGFLVAVRRRRKEAESKMREVEREMDVVEQARRIEAQSRAGRPGEEVDAELKELVEKWRSASRQAAEEVLDLVRDRVSNMGGVKAWKETRKRRADFFDGFDAEGGGGQRSADAEELPEEAGSEADGPYDGPEGGSSPHRKRRRRRGSGEVEEVREGEEGENEEADENSVCWTVPTCIAMRCARLLTEIGIYDVDDAPESEYRP